MLKSLLIALSLGVSSIAISSPATAQNNDVAPVNKTGNHDATIKQMQNMFTAMFGPPNTEPIDPQRLALAQQTVAKIMPTGIYAKMMGGMMDKIMGSMFGGSNGMGDFEIMIATGLELGELKLDPEKRIAVTQLLDSNYTERSKLTREMMNPMFNKMISVIEPPMREGMSRAYARKFTPEQLIELNRFFATPTGGFYASEAFAIQADPEVMQSMMSAIPLMMSEFKEPASDMQAKVNALPKPRRLDQLSDTELDKMAQLLGTTSDALKEHSKVTALQNEAVDAVAVENPFADETGDEPWYDGTNWTTAQRSNVAKLSDAYIRTQDKNNAAYEAYEAAENAAVDAARKRFLANGWKPEPQDKNEGATAGPADGPPAEEGTPGAAARPQ
jgi:hypothetical protein